MMEDKKEQKNPLQLVRTLNAAKSSYVFADIVTDTAKHYHVLYKLQ